MNSILQCLFASPGLNGYFIKGTHENELNSKSKTKGKLAKSYATLVKSAKGGSVPRMVIYDFKSLIGRYNSQFMGYGQQDSQEFLRFALDGLSADLNRVTKKKEYKELKFTTETKHEQAEAWWEYFKNRENSHITDLFLGQLVSITE